MVTKLDYRSLGPTHSGGVHYVFSVRREGGEVGPQPSPVLKLFKALGITPNQLLGVTLQPQKSGLSHATDKAEG